MTLIKRDGVIKVEFLQYFKSRFFPYLLWTILQPAFAYSKLTKLTITKLTPEQCVKSVQKFQRHQKDVSASFMQFGSV